MIYYTDGKNVYTKDEIPPETEVEATVPEVQEKQPKASKITKTKEKN